MRPSLGYVREEGVEKERPGTQDPGVTKIPELTGLLESGDDKGISFEV